MSLREEKHSEVEREESTAASEEEEHGGVESEEEHEMMVVSEEKEDGEIQYCPADASCLQLMCLHANNVLHAV